MLVAAANSSGPQVTSAKRQEHTGTDLGRFTSYDLDGLAEKIKNQKKKNKIVVMVGAGISCNAGIPDFRTPGTGLYSNLMSYSLPHPEAIFDLSFFRSNPEPFYRLCQEIWPGQYTPTPTHLFISLLHQKQLLKRCYTQNIDSLETQAGVPSDKLIAAHGNFDSASGIDTGRPVPISEVKAACSKGLDGWKDLNSKYGELVKPNIVFFGEQLPDRFYASVANDFSECDLLIVIGTSLVVQPFASLIGFPPPSCVRVLINRESAGESRMMLRQGFNFTERKRDLFLQGDCDQVVTELISKLDWTKDFNVLRKTKEDAISS